MGERSGRATGAASKANGPEASAGVPAPRGGAKAPAGRAAARKATGPPEAAAAGKGAAGKTGASTSKAPAAKKAPAKRTAAAATKATATKATATKATAKKATAKKATAKKATAKKATAKKATPASSSPSSLPVRDEESPWTRQELATVRSEIEAEIDRLRAEIEAAEVQLSELIRDSGTGAGDDPADSGAKAFEREHEMSLANNARETLAQEERALQRIEAGTYGTCEGCGNPIGKRRLQAFPRATLCISCKQKQSRH